MRYILLSTLVIVLYSCKKYGCISGDCLNGYSEVRYENDGFYKGFWKNGQPDGFGTMFFGKGPYEGDIYNGYFKDGQENGTGTYYFKKLDSKMIGAFSNNKPSGICTIIFGKHAPWKGTFKGKWIDGQCREFDVFSKISSDGEFISKNAKEFFDTINYYYKKGKTQNFIDSLLIVVKVVFKNEKVSFKEIDSIIKLYQSTQQNLLFSINNIKSFKEFDHDIQYKKATVEYLDVIYKGFDNELPTLILTLQHDPDMAKLSLIKTTMLPYLNRVKSQGLIWEKVKYDFVNKYKKNNS